MEPSTPRVLESGPLKTSNTTMARRLNTLSNTKTLKISGDLPLVLVKVLLFRNNGRND
jgi:hypothetical protein